MSFDARRLAYEIQSLAQMGRGGICRVPGGRPDDYASYFHQFPFRGYVVTVRLTTTHPLDHPRIEIRPYPVGNHCPDGVLCWLAPGEWKPEHTMAGAAAIARRYLGEVLRQKGR